MDSKLKSAYFEWSDHSDTHTNRHLKIIYKHTEIARRWIEVVKSYPVGSQEMLAEINILWKQLGDIFEDSKEVCSDFANDSKLLVEVIDLLKEEFDKLYDEQSKEKDKKWT